MKLSDEFTLVSMAPGANGTLETIGVHPLVLNNGCVARGSKYRFFLSSI